MTHFSIVAGTISGVFQLCLDVVPAQIRTRMRRSGNATCEYLHVAFVLAALSWCGVSTTAAHNEMELSSPYFREGEDIPVK